MIFLIFGTVLLGLKLAQIDPVSSWPWWLVAAPYAFAVIWVEIIEPMLGLDKRRQMKERDRFLTKYGLDASSKRISRVGKMVKRADSRKSR